MPAALFESTNRRVCAVAALQPDKPFDPGGQGGENGGTGHLPMSLAISYATARQAAYSQEMESRTELVSHANMPVVGKHAYILAELGKTVEVNPYTPDYKSMSVPLVDAAVQYDCPYDGSLCAGAT